MKKERIALSIILILVVGIGAFLIVNAQKRIKILESALQEHEQVKPESTTQAVMPTTSSTPVSANKVAPKATKSSDPFPVEPNCNPNADFGKDYETYKRTYDACKQQKNEWEAKKQEWYARNGESVNVNISE